MFGIDVEVVLENAPPGTAGNGDQAAPLDDPDADLAIWWATHGLEQFLRFPVVRRLDPIDVTLELLGEPVGFTVRFDQNLLTDLLEAYAAHGWAAIDEVETRVARLGPIMKPSLDFVRITRNVIAVMVADSLCRLEKLAVGFAGQSWTASREKLRSWLGHFTATKQLQTVWITDRKVGDKLRTQCHQYAVTRRQVMALQKKVSERNRKDPPARRVKGSGFELWFELYATPHRKLLGQLADQFTAIGRTFPPAVLVLDDLPGEIFDIGSALARGQAAIALDLAIHTRLTQLVGMLDTLQATLKQPPVTAVLAEVVDPISALDTTGLAELEPPKGGYEQQVIDAVFERTDDTEQRLLANLELLIKVQESDLVQAGSVDQLVLYRYIQRLADEVDRRREREQAWDTFWTWLERIGAALALLALMAVFPFGTAVAPALAGALVLAGTAATVIGIVVLVLHQVIGAMQNAGELDAAARDKLFRLGQEDPAAMQEIGEALATSRTLRAAVAEGALLTILTLGAAHKIKVIAVALEFQGFAADVETLFRPADPAEPAQPGPDDG